MTQPGLARIMPEVSIRIWKLYYAGKARNWPLARFQLKEAINLMEVGAFVRPKYEVNMAKFIDEDAGPVGKAIEAGDWDAFDAAFHEMGDKANAYHDEDGKPVMRWRTQARAPPDRDV